MSILVPAVILHAMAKKQLIHQAIKGMLIIKQMHHHCYEHLPCSIKFSRFTGYITEDLTRLQAL